MFASSSGEVHVSLYHSADNTIISNKLFGARLGVRTIRSRYNTLTVTVPNTQCRLLQRFTVHLRL